jgi:hypothetical protein
MNLPRFKSLDLLPSGSKVTTNFGWDIGPKNVDELQKDLEVKVWPRIHHAIDEVGPGIMVVPFDCDSTEWIPKDSAGCSELRLIKNDETGKPVYELRLLHINEKEIDKDTFVLIKNKKGLKKGTKLAPCGNTGLSFGDNGGYHVHYSFYCMPGIFDKELDDRFGDYWKENKTKDLTTQYGKPFTNQIALRAIIWINSYAVKRWDRLWSRNMIILNTKKVFE